jgi:hypothetical protein
MLMEDGSSVKVSDLPTEAILDCIDGGIEVMTGDTKEAVLERLRLELFIREMGLKE